MHEVLLNMKVTQDRPPRHPIALALYEASHRSNIPPYHLKRIIDARVRSPIFLSLNLIFIPLDVGRGARGTSTFNSFHSNLTRRINLVHPAVLAIISAFPFILHPLTRRLSSRHRTNIRNAPPRTPISRVQRAHNNTCGDHSEAWGQPGRNI